MPISVPSYATSMNVSFTDEGLENVIVLYKGSNVNDRDKVLCWDRLSESGKREFLEAIAATGKTGLDNEGILLDVESNAFFSVSFESFDPATDALSDVLPASYIATTPSATLNFGGPLNGTAATGIPDDSTMYTFEFRILDDEGTQVNSTASVSASGSNLQTYADVISNFETKMQTSNVDYGAGTITINNPPYMESGKVYTVTLESATPGPANITTVLPGLSATVVNGGSDKELTLNVSYAGVVERVSASPAAGDTLNDFLQNVSGFPFSVSAVDATTTKVGLANVTTPTGHRVKISGDLFEVLSDALDEEVTIDIPSYAVNGIQALENFRTATGSNAYTKYKEFIVSISDLPTDSQYRSARGRTGVKAFFARGSDTLIMVEYDGVLYGPIDTNASEE